MAPTWSLKTGNAARQSFAWAIPSQISVDDHSPPFRSGVRVSFLRAFSEMAKGEHPTLPHNNPPDETSPQGEGDPRPPVLAHSYLDDHLSDIDRFRLLRLSEAKGFASRLDFIAAHADSVEAVLCGPRWPLDKQTIAALPRLRCIVTTSTGVDHIDLDECRRLGIAVANAGDVFTEDVADYAIGLLFSVLRRVPAADRYVRKGLWAVNGDYPLGSKLTGKRVGIIGLGRIGSAIARRLDAFGCVMNYHSRNVKPSVSYPYFSNVRELASRCDVLIAACELNKETYHIVNRDVLVALGKNGVVINIGRGSLVDEKELVRCLIEGEIGGAGLDVFEAEPNVPQELYCLDNVVLSPHVAVITLESLQNLVQLVTANLEAFFTGRPLLTPYPNF